MIDETSRRFDLDDYDADSGSSQGGSYQLPKQRFNIPPIKNTELDLKNTKDPIIQRLLKKMEMERFMIDEPNLSIRFEEYKKKVYNSNKTGDAE